MRFTKTCFIKTFLFILHYAILFNYFKQLINNGSFDKYDPHHYCVKLELQNDSIKSRKIF